MDAQMELLDRRAVRTWVISLAQAVSGAYFFVAGLLTVAGAAVITQAFARWGWPGWARIAVGAVELVGGVGLVVPALARKAALALAALTGLFMAIRLGKLEIFPELLEPLLLLPLLLFVARAIPREDGEQKPDHRGGWTHRVLRHARVPSRRRRH